MQRCAPFLRILLQDSEFALNDINNVVINEYDKYEGLDIIKSVHGALKHTRSLVL